eukprot:scaffold426486_cov48-Prasinocladus_malaysianus.AAC.1
MQYISMHNKLLPYIRWIARHLLGTIYYSGGYNEPESQVLGDGTRVVVYAWDRRMLLTDLIMRDQGSRVEEVRKFVREGKTPKAELKRVMQETGCTGLAQVALLLPWVDLTTFFQLPPGHLVLHGVLKKYVRGFQDKFGAIGFKCLKKNDLRLASYVQFPGSFQRPVRRLIPDSCTSSTDNKAMSGFTMEDEWHYAETFSIVATLPHLEKETAAAIEASTNMSPAVKQELLSSLDRYMHGFLRLQGIIFYLLRANRAERVVTSSDSQDRLFQVNSQIKADRRRFDADCRAFARIQELVFGHSYNTSNTHTLVVHTIHYMERCGHPHLESAMEMLVGQVKRGVRGTRHVEATVVNDHLRSSTAQEMKHHPNYKPVVPLEARGRAMWIMDNLPVGYGAASLRLLGKPKQASGVYSIEYLEELVCHLVSQQGREGMLFEERLVLGWSPDHIGTAAMTIHARCGIPSRVLHGTLYKGRNVARDDTWFVFWCPKGEIGPEFSPVTDEELLSIESMPRNEATLDLDRRYNAFIAQAHCFVGVVPSGAGGERRPLRLAICRVFEPSFRLPTGVGMQGWEVDMTEPFMEDVAIPLDGGYEKLVMCTPKETSTDEEVDGCGLRRNIAHFATIHARSGHGMTF